MENTYKSIYGADNNINISQYIAELIVSRLSKWKKVVLPDQFWKNPAFMEWTKTFRLQKMRADALHKAGYEYTTILRALNSQQGRYIASLYNKKLDFLLEEEQRKIDLEKQAPTIDLEIAPVDEVPKIYISSKKNIIDKLRD